MLTTPLKSSPGDFWRALLHIYQKAIPDGGATLSELDEVISDTWYSETVIKSSLPSDSSMLCSAVEPAHGTKKATAGQIVLIKALNNLITEKFMENSARVFECRCKLTDALVIVNEKAIKFEEITPLLKEISFKFDEIDAKHSEVETKLYEIRVKYEEIIATLFGPSYLDLQKMRDQYEVERRFFAPARTKSLCTYRIADELAFWRSSGITIKTKPLNITGMAARRSITAEVSTFQAAIDLGFTADVDGAGYLKGIGWTVVPTKTKLRQSAAAKVYSQQYAPDETILLGSTSIVYEQRVNPNECLLGDFFMHDLGSYTDIIYNLYVIAGIDLLIGESKPKEIELAKLMQQFCRTGSPATLAALRIINPVVTEEYVNMLNRIMYHCFVKEIAARHLQKYIGYQLPLAIAQIRALQLIIDGRLSLQDVFAPDAPYGVFTGTEIYKHIEKLQTKIMAINKLYDTHNAASYGKFFSTKEDWHQELQRGFGAKSDSDGDDYDTALFVKKDNNNVYDIKMF